MIELIQSLQDGFQEIITFEGHRLHIRGFNVVEINDDCHKIQNSELSTKLQFISWDVKQILLWESNLSTGRPVILSNMKFSSQPNFICSVIYIPKLKIFLAAALDMSFKIYDRHLTLLESIHHEERAILQLEYDPKKDILLSAGASGISIWKIYRNNSLNLAHILEKLYSFENCSDWVNKMIYEPKNDRIYAIRDRSAQILSVSRRSIINELRNVHEAPLSAVCWYERNQFYITGCRLVLHLVLLV
jgi:WD40 repeat protein